MVVCKGKPFRQLDWTVQDTIDCTCMCYIDGLRTQAVIHHRFAVVQLLPRSWKYSQELVKLLGAFRILLLATNGGCGNRQ